MRRKQQRGTELNRLHRQGNCGEAGVEMRRIAEKAFDTSNRFLAGWSEVDITPESKVLLTGLFFARLSEGVKDRLTATAWAIESGEEQVVFVGCDLICISDCLRDSVRRRVEELNLGVRPECVLLHATHSHTAPETRPPSEQGLNMTSRGIGVETDAMPVTEYVAYAAERIAQAVAEAWRKRIVGGVAYGLGTAVVGRNRRWVNAEGVATTGRLNRDTGKTFRHIEGYEDHFINLAAVYDRHERLVGLVVNIACPSQRNQMDFQISADWWCETRRELRRRFGESLYILPQCSAAGDQYPFIVHGQEAELRMLALKKRTEQEETAMRIADGIGEALPYMGQAIDWNPVLRHRTTTVRLPMGRLTEEDARKAEQQASELRIKYEQELRKLNERPELRSDTRWYQQASDAYLRSNWHMQVVRRYERQLAEPEARLAAEVHVVRLGDIAFASNPYELYLDYGLQIKVRSPAIQTFLIQLAGEGTYIPSPRSVSGGGYGSVPASNPVGAEGGQQLVEHLVDTLWQLWDGEQQPSIRNGS